MSLGSVSRLRLRNASPTKPTIKRAAPATMSQCGYPIDVKASVIFLLAHNVKARHRQRQLHIVITSFVPIGEILQVKWDISHLQVAAPAQFMRYVLGDVFRPAFSR